MTGSRAHDLHYGLDDRPRGLALWLYTLQFLAFSVANSAVVPIVVGAALGLDEAATAALVQRTFFLCAVGSALQVAFGHRYPIFEGPAGVWFSVVIALASAADAAGKPLATLRTDLELGLLAAGAVTVSLGAFGLMSRVHRLFTPLVNGVFLCVMGLQLSASIVRGIAGVGSGGPSGKALAVSAIAVISAVWVSFRARGFVASVGILAGTVAGWLAAVALGIAPQGRWHSAAAFAAPRWLAWGHPTYDVGIVLTCVVAGVAVLANLVASVAGMAELTASTADARRMNRGAFFTGISDLLGGFGAVVGFIPYASSLGLVGMSRVAARLPFLIATLALAVLALFPMVGQMLAALPPPVGYAVLLVTFSQVVVLGMKNVARVVQEPRSAFIVGLSLMIGVGILSIPASALREVPPWARYLVGNGLLVATALSMFLQHTITGAPAPARPLVVAAQEADS